MSLLTPALPVAAQTPAPAPLQTGATNGGTVIAWDGQAAGVGAAGADALSALAASLEVQRYQGYDLPMEVIALRVSSLEAAQVQIHALAAVDLPPASVLPGTPDVPPVILEEGAQLPVLNTPPALPTAPVFVLRSGQVDDAWLLVLGLSPIYSENGVLKLATQVTAFVPESQQIQGPAWQSNPLNLPEAAVDAASAEAGAVADAPTEEDALTATVKVRVDQPGIQRLLRADLAAINPAYATVSFANLRISIKRTVAEAEVTIPVQRVSADEVRFYVDKVGDRWNTSSFYLVRIATAPNPASPNMADPRTVTPPAAGSVSTVLERGEARVGRRYNSNFPGTDGDHYFAANVTRTPTDSEIITVTNTLTESLTGATILPANSLPLVAGTTNITLRVSPYRADSASLPSYGLKVGRIVDGNRTYQDVTIPNVEDSSNLGDWLGTVPVSFAMAGPVPAISITLKRAAWPTGLLIEAIGYERPVSLNLNNKGARFAAAAGATTFRWANWAPGTPLYDVTNPAAPIVLTGATAAGFVDTPPGAPVSRTYLVAGAGFLHKATPERLLAVAVPDLPGYDAVYIYPNADYRAALQPLLDHRKVRTCPFPAAKCNVLAVDVRQIYDKYSGGHVSPQAIRAFLQEAYTKWRRSSATPTGTVLDAAILIGDGTYDPKNFEKKGKNFNLIPPYLREDIDPYISEAACERCYGQLTGADPHTGDDPNGRMFETEIWIGRFPVNTVEELTNTINKTIAYETTAPTSPQSRSRVLYLADNYRKALDANKRLVFDSAGDFARMTNEIRDLNPESGSLHLAPRVFYDPLPAYQIYQPPDSGVGPDVPLANPANFPWHYPSAANARAGWLRDVNEGVAIMVYNGHANTFQLGKTEEKAYPDDALVWLPDRNIANTGPANLFVMISMTCLSSQFVQPTDGGVVLDEGFFVIKDKGAAMTWGPTGLSLVSGHDALQRGFFESLFNGPRNQYMGWLMDDGYLELLLTSPGHEDVLRTFVFFGDPLTRIRYTPGSGLFLPLINSD